jgi:UDP-N-acetylglucosamine--N-acetylmuramyl-(pentapeptide) pyrophosphoryl-undecaprenol N-acetylglucosamine transferase
VTEEGVFAMFAGGGTGGHIYPAIAVAQELVRRGHPPETLRFVGGRRGIEGRVVTEAGFAIDLLAGRGLQRRLTPANLGAIWGAFSALLVSLRLVRRYRPRVVIGSGGYASLPCVVAARVLRVPTVVHDQDAVPGLANRIGARLGARSAVCDRGHCPGTGTESCAARRLRRLAGRPYDQPRRGRLL